MSDNVNEFETTLDDETYSYIKEVCARYDFEEKQVIRYVLNHSFDDFLAGYQQLKQGYLEMGTLNLEISNAFIATENEALSYYDL